MASGFAGSFRRPQSDVLPEALWWPGTSLWCDALWQLAIAPFVAPSEATAAKVAQQAVQEFAEEVQANQHRIEIVLCCSLAEGSTS